MSKQEKIFDDLARLAGGTIGLAGEAKKKAETALKLRIDEWAQQMDLVPREDFERLEALLVQSRIAQEDLQKRVEALETALLKKK